MTEIYRVKLGFKADLGEIIPGIEFMIAGESQEDATNRSLEVVASRLSIQVTPLADEEPFDPVPDELVTTAEAAAALPEENLEGIAGPGKFWISWHHKDEYSGPTLLCPWWKIDHAEGGEAICAAIKATDAIEAREIVKRSLLNCPTRLRFRFCDVQADEWHPFSGRFPRADWMIWNERVATDAG